MVLRLLLCCGLFHTGAAQRDGRLAVGDQLLQVDGADLTNVEHGVWLCDDVVVVVDDGDDL